MNKKGQTWSFDLIIAVVLFVIVVGLFYGFITKDEQNKENELQQGTKVLAYKLNCDTNPNYKNCVVNDGVVTEDALDKLYQEDYEKLKKDLNIKGEFCIYLRDTDGNLIPVGDKTSIGTNELSLTESIQCGDNVANAGAPGAGV